MNAQLKTQWPQASPRFAYLLKNLYLQSTGKRIQNSATLLSTLDSEISAQNLEAVKWE